MSVERGALRYKALRYHRLPTLSPEARGRAHGSLSSVEPLETLRRTYGCGLCRVCVPSRRKSSLETVAYNVTLFAVGAGPNYLAEPVSEASSCSKRLEGNRAA